MTDLSPVAHLERLQKQCAKNFDRHEITSRAGGRWCLHRRNKDGSLDSAYAAEVIVLSRDGIYVGGDIDCIVFAYGPADPIARLRWIGENRDVGYYVRQKAAVGMSSTDLVDAWESDVARWQIRDAMSNQRLRVRDENALNDALEAEDRHTFIDAMIEACGYDEYETFHDFGDVLAGRVVNGHAAIARLCVLLRAEEQALIPVPVGGKPVAVLTTEEIVRLPREKAVEHFDAHSNNWKANVRGLPVAEQLRLAADLIEKLPDVARNVIALAQRGLRIAPPTGAVIKPWCNAPECPACENPAGTPVALSYDPNFDAVRARKKGPQLYCQACGHEWVEADPVRLMQAWWSAGAREGHMEHESATDTKGT